MENLKKQSAMDTGNDGDGSLHNFTQCCNIADNVARMGEESGVYRVLVGKPEGRRPLGKPRRRWVDNIRMDLQEVECGYM